MGRTVLGCVIVGTIVLGAQHQRFENVEAAQPVPQQESIPLFELDPSWPKLPAKWKFGAVSNIAIDAQDHAWILQRPRSLPVDQKALAAPAVLEFDTKGDFVQGWGGPTNAYEWPELEHGIHVDYKGNVWIGGVNCPERNMRELNPVSDDQLLKFTRQGKFLLQIGKSNQSRRNRDTSNLRMPADAFVYQKTNEVFVADGYGNRRVIVFDADSGEFKRLWGAFGGPPVDAYRCPTAEVDRSGLQGDGPGPKRFDVVHMVRVSNDGLVYVADKNYRRIQVFSLDGKFVDQLFIDRHAGGNPQGLTFSPDPDQKFMYVASVDIVVVDRKTLRVLGSVPKSRVERGPGHHNIATDSKGNIYVAEGTQGRAHKWTFKGMPSAHTP